MAPRPFRPTVALVHALLASWWLAAPGVAWGQHGQFDQTPINEADESYIFTPSGFAGEGRVAVAEGPSAGRLNVTIVDAATGQPTFCRVNVVGGDGNFYQPRDNPLSAYSLNGRWPDTLAGNRPAKAPIRYFGHFFYTSGAFAVDVPEGTVRIEVWKGFEYRPEVLTTRATAGSSHDLRLSIARTTPMAAEGWYSGDPHLHFIRASDADDGRIFDLLEAEDIRLGTILCYNETNAYPGLMPELVTPQLRGLGVKSIRSRGDYQIISGQEYRNVVFGHLNLFLRDSLVLDGQRLDPNVGPVFGAIGAETQKQGGYAFHAHGGYGLEIWADLVQRATSGVELLQFGIYRGIGLEGWYHVLNAGFRFPGIAASDYPACRKLGDCRTYVHLDGPANASDWLRGAAEGRSFMTTGPLVLLDVDGHRPGETIASGDDKPRRVTARVRVRSETAPVTHVQLIESGRVVRELTVPASAALGHWIQLEEPIELAESSWIAARAFSKSPSGSADAESHTNPVYVHLNGRPPYHESDLDWLLARLDEQIADHQARKVPEKTVPIEYFNRSRELLVEMRRQGGPAQLSTATSGSGEAIDVTPGSSRGQSLAEVLKPVPARSPADAARSFECQAGFHMQLVAHEPDVTSPVAACFDENGGMYVAEMIDYPYRPKPGTTPLGRVRYLVDEDNDGRYEKSWILADGLAWPTGVVCFKGGVYVAAAPDIWYLKDTDGDHKADVRQRVYTGFGDQNQQGGVNNLNWCIDHTIYGSASTNGGSIRPGDAPDANPIVLSGRDFRFDPSTGRFETVSGSRQFGNAFDDWFNRFLCDESDPAYHVVLPQRYLACNPYLPVGTALCDLAPGVTQIFRISPIEKWREIRSSRRIAAGVRSPSSSGVSHNVIDAAAGLTIYRGHAYPAQYRGNLFVGCSQNNLIHRRELTPKGATFRSARADKDTEFVRTDDIWFRPVNCINAPDGTLFVLDMAREVIESIHIANDVVKHLDLTSGRDKGRIYRLAPADFKVPTPPRLGCASTAELVATLDHPGGWWRDTAARLLFERQDPSAVELLHRALVGASPLGRLHLLWALDAQGALEPRDLELALDDASPGVREHAVRLSEDRFGSSPDLLDKVLALAADPEPRVRFQVAFSLGQIDEPRAVAALASIAARDTNEPWIRTAVLSSSTARSDRLLAALATQADFLAQGATAANWLEQLATIVGARNHRDEVDRTLATAASAPADSIVSRAVLLGLGAGLQRASSSLSDVQRGTTAETAALLDRALEQTIHTAADADAAFDARQQAVRLLGYFGSPQAIDALVSLVEGPQSEALKLLVIRNLARVGRDEIAPHLIAVWKSATPGVQEEIITTLASRPAWALQLLDACQRDQISASQVTSATRASLVNHHDANVKSQAEKLLGAASGARGEVIARYQSALALLGDAARGDKIYERECSVCHRLAERGFAVGPNLALVRNRTPAAMLEAILDPNREVQPRYVNYVVVDDSGRTTTGLITSETANSITLARDKGATETILKSNIEQLHSTGQSLMPEGLEKNVDPQGLADLLLFLGQVQYDIGTLPNFKEPGE